MQIGIPNPIQPHLYYPSQILLLYGVYNFPWCLFLCLLTLANLCKVTCLGALLHFLSVAGQNSLLPFLLAFHSNIVLSLKIHLLLFALSTAHVPPSSNIFLHKYVPVCLIVQKEQNCKFKLIVYLTNQSAHLDMHHGEYTFSSVQASSIHRFNLV